LEDEKVNNALERILERLVEVSHRPNLKYRITVINDPTPNAFALPGGFIYITTGLLEILETEDEVAAVLAHEVAHTSARHWVKYMEKQEKRKNFFDIFGDLIYLGGLFISAYVIDQETFKKLSEWGIADDVFDLGGRLALNISFFCSEAIIKGYGRANELEADRLAFYYLEEAGFDPWGKISLLEKLAQLEKKEKITYGILSSHPSTENRISNLKEEQKR
jgi:predicted Zn-dependent protease